MDEKLATENLFLLEFLVDEVNMDSKCDSDTPPGEHCVSFQFLDNDPMDVCEADFIPNRKFGRDPDGRKSGKSCLFSLDPDQVESARKVFDLHVTVWKKMQPGWLPEKISVGTALISISNLFVELVRCVQKQEYQGPCAKTLKDAFFLTDNEGSSVGRIGIYIRMSCFGKLIVTQFQMNLDDKSILFKDKRGQSLYRYKKVQQGEENGGEGSERANLRNLSCPMRACNEGAPSMQSMGLYEAPCNECGGAVGAQPPQCLLPDRFNSQMLTACDECGTVLAQNFPVEQQAPPGTWQEIGAAMGGNALTIRVHKDKAKVEQCESTSCQPPTAIDFGPNQQLPFSFKMANQGQQPPNNNITINPPICSMPDGTKFTEFSDPNKEMFVLRIGKKSEGVQKKAHLELELCTPRGSELKPIPKKETRDSQYDPADVKKEKAKPKKKGKGKKKRKKGKK